MADLVSYQLINNTGSQLNLVGTAQFPTNWIEPVPTTLPIGAQPTITNHTGQLGVTIVFGYSIEGSSSSQFWVVSNFDDANSGPQVGQLAPSGHSIQVDVEGDSEDGFSVTLTYQ
jgi:hypothetical protein